MSKEPRDVLDQVRLRFERFRSANEPRTRIPAELRQAVVNALAQGVPMSALRRTCGLSSKQVAEWQMGPLAASVKPARVFEVTDAEGTTDALEVRVGCWNLTIRNAAA